MESILIGAGFGMVAGIVLAIVHGVQKAKRKRPRNYWVP